MKTTTSVELASAITAAWLGNPHTRAGMDDVPVFLIAMHQALEGLGKATNDAEVPGTTVEHVPAVSIRKSLANPDYLVSLIDGRAYRSLKRHLTANGLSADEYRQRYGLKSDYPMVAPGYSAVRSAKAKELGLGRKAKVATHPAGDTGKKTVKTASKGIAAAKAAAKAHLGG